MYIFGDSPDCEREFVIRTQYPRFIGEIVDDETIAEILLVLGNGEAVAVQQWIDEPQPVDAMVVLIDEIRQALAEHEEALGL